MTSDVGLVHGYKLERNHPQQRIWAGSGYDLFARQNPRLHARSFTAE